LAGCGFITLVSVWQRTRAPAVIAAWAVYLALLLPVSGLMQVGPQAAADRFMYLAMVPILVLVGCGCVWFARQSSWMGRIALGLLMICEFAFYAYRPQAQIPVWKNEETMFREVLMYYPQSSTANFHLAMALVDRRRFDEALPYAEYAAGTLTNMPEAPMACS